jgi:MFS family permease
MRVAGETGFARLWGAAGVSNFGDGVYGTALPLLAATLTRDPLLVSLVSFAEWLPWLLFGLLSGALLDRWDRRRVMWTVDAARFAVVGGLAVAVLLGEASIVLLGIVGFLLGTGQTLVDTGSHSILPALVSRDPERLERANGRLVGTQVVTQELAGPPVGGFLFSLSAWTPFAVAAGDGRHGAVVNLLAAGGGAVMVLFAQEKLGLDAVGFGLLFSGSAVGGVLGSLVAARVTRVVGTARVTVWTMVASALAYLVFGLSSDPWLAGVMFGLVGFLTVVFNVILGSLRQALTPGRLLGRVISAFRLFSYGTVPLGSLLGGVLARSFGLRAPFVVAGVVIPLAAVLCLPAVNARTLAEARAAAGLEPGP